VNRATRKLIRDYIGTVLIAVSVALTIRFLIIEAYRIPSSAMKPTLEAGDTIFVSKWPYGLRSLGISPGKPEKLIPKRGAVIVFEGPDPSGIGTQDFIKRVVGLPGDIVQVKDGKITLNRKPLPLAAGPSATCGEERLTPELQYSVCWEPPIIEDFGPAIIPANQVFVIGDLRSQPPTDTRKHKSWGLVSINAIKGRAQWIWLSIEPRGRSGQTSWFPQIRFERMLRRIQ